MNDIAIVETAPPAPLPVLLTDDYVLGLVQSGRVDIIQHYLSQGAAKLSDDQLQVLARYMEGAAGTALANKKNSVEKQVADNMGNTQALLADLLRNSNQYIDGVRVPGGRREPIDVPSKIVKDEDLITVPGVGGVGGEQINFELFAKRANMAGEG